MILIGLLIWIALFVVLTLLCNILPGMSTLDWLLVLIGAAAGALCGYFASKYKKKRQD